MTPAIVPAGSLHATPTRVALVDDDGDLRAATAQLLTLAGHDVVSLPDAAAALAVVTADFDGVVVTDVRMPGMSGIELFRTLHERDPELPVVLVTGHGDVGMAVDALKAGAWDFLAKPFDPEALLAAVARGIAARALALENRRLRRLAAAADDDMLVGDSDAARRLRAMAPLLAQAGLDVVVEGATGTGKQLFARMIHRAGPRSRARFLSVDCAALPPGIAERELLARNGVVAGAHRGTLFLTNLHRADHALQHRLALFAEKRAVALDTRDPDPLDVQIVAGIDDGARAALVPALYHRLAGAPVRLPTLAERAGDVPLLVAHFAARAAARHRRPLPPMAEVAHRFARDAWPGNVRQLEMAVERVVLGLDEVPGTAAAGASLPDRLDAFERAAIEEALAETGGQVTAAIARLGVPRKTFYYRANRLGIDLKAARRDARRTV